MASLQARAPAVVRSSSLRALKHPTVPPPPAEPRGFLCHWQAPHSRLFLTLIQPPEQPLPAAPSYGGRKRPLYIQHVASVCLRHSQTPLLTRSFSSAEAVSPPLPSLDEAFTCRVSEEGLCSAEASNGSGSALTQSNSEAATHRSSESAGLNNVEVTTLRNLEAATHGYVEAETHVEGSDVAFERAKDDSCLSIDNVALKSLLESLQQTVDHQSKTIALLQDEVNEMKRSLSLLPSKLDPSKIIASSSARGTSIREVTELAAKVGVPGEIKSKGSKIAEDWFSFLDHLKALKSFRELQAAGNNGHNVFEDPTTLKRALAKFSQVYDTTFDSLSREDLQGLAQYGCPSDDPRTVASGKRLRSYLQVKEKQVCEPCVMQSSCESAFVKPAVSQARLADVMRLLYKTFEVSLPREKGRLPGDVALSIQRLLKDITSLSLKHDITLQGQDPSVSSSMNSAHSGALKHTGEKVPESLGLDESNLGSPDTVCVMSSTPEKLEIDSACLGGISQEKNEREDAASNEELRADNRAVSLLIKDQRASDKLREEDLPSDKESKQPLMVKSKGKVKSGPILDGLEDGLKDVTDADDSDEDSDEEDDNELDELTDESDDDESMVDDDELDKLEDESDDDEITGDDDELKSSKEDEHTKLFDDLVKKDTSMTATESGKKSAKKHLDLPQQLSASESQKEFARKTPLSELVSVNANAFRPRNEQYQGNDDSRGDGRMSRGRGYGNDQYSSNSRRMPNRDSNEEEVSSNEYSSRRSSRERGGDTSFRGGYRSDPRGSSSDYGGGQGRRGFQDRSSDYRSGRADTGARGRSYGDRPRWADGGERNRGFGRSLAEDESDQEDHRTERGRGSRSGRGRPRGYESEQQEYRSDRRNGGRGRPKF